MLSRRGISPAVSVIFRWISPTPAAGRKGVVSCFAKPAREALIGALVPTRSRAARYAETNPHMLDGRSDSANGRDA